MTSPSEFESLLTERGFKITFRESCDHTDHWMFFVQEDTEEESQAIIRSKELGWAVHKLCERCLDNYSGVLFCGGHYTNTRLFDASGKQNTDYDYPHYDPDPEEIVYEPEDSESEDI